MNARSLLWHGISMALHAGLLAGSALFVPPLPMPDEGMISDEQTVAIRMRLDALDEKELAEAVDAQPTDRRDGYGAPDRIPRDNWLAAHCGWLWEAISISHRKGGHDGVPRVWTAPRRAGGGTFGPALQIEFGSWINDSFGFGLAARGIGESGGGFVDRLDIGPLDPFGHGAVGGSLQGLRPRGGSSVGIAGRSHKADPPRVRASLATVNGRLRPEVIQRIVSRKLSRFRLCYDVGLRGDPSLQGRVALRFVIGRDGAVSRVSNDGTDMADAGVVSCVAGAFYGLSFPEPAGGIVMVTYRVTFTRGR